MWLRTNNVGHHCSVFSLSLRFLLLLHVLPVVCPPLSWDWLRTRVHALPYQQRVRTQTAAQALADRPWLAGGVGDAGLPEVPHVDVEWAHGLGLKGGARGAPALPRLGRLACDSLVGLAHHHAEELARVFGVLRGFCDTDHWESLVLSVPDALEVDRDFFQVYCLRQCNNTL